LTVIAFPDADPEGGRIGERLRTWRTRRGTTLEDLSRGTGLALEHLRRVEAGRARLAADEIEALGRRLGVPVWALGGSPPAT
jgi:transcriptional regulator with XRE-family HTH domain